MATELIRPIDAETARAAEELAKTTGKALDLAGDAGGYAADVFARAPHDLVGYLIGDRLYHARIRQWARLTERTRQILVERGAEEPFEQASPSIEVPLIEAAIDETRDELAEIWAKLLAAAKDPKRRASVRRDVIEAVKALEPMDALILASFHQQAPGSGQHLRNVMSERLRLGSEDVDVSTGALIRIGLLGTATRPRITLRPSARC